MKRALLLALLVVVGAACGGREQATSPTATGGEIPQGAVAAAGEKTRAAGTARVSFTLTMSGAQGAGTISGEGATARQRAHMTMNMSGLAGGALGGGELELIFDKLVFYVKPPAGSVSQLPAGKKWLKIDLAKLSKAGVLDAADLMQLNQSDPTQALDLLRGAGDFEVVGHDEVRGVETTHYRGTIDLEKAVENAPADAQDQARQLFEQSGLSTVPAEIWVDADGLVRQLEFTEKLPGVSMKVHEELYDFGAEVDTAPPPADQVLDITALLGNS
jgi:hypothetical protein